MNSDGFIRAFVTEVRNIYQTQDYIPLHAPVFKGREKDLVIQALESTFVSSVGKSVEEFEVEIAQYTGARYAVAVSSGTAALHSALYAIGVERGHEVELEYAKKEIMDKMNYFFGYSVVKKLKFISFNSEKEITLKDHLGKKKTINRFQKKVNDVKNKKIKKSLLDLAKVFKEK